MEHAGEKRTPFSVSTEEHSQSLVHHLVEEASRSIEILERTRRSLATSGDSCDKCQLLDKSLVKVIRSSPGS